MLGRYSRIVLTAVLSAVALAWWFFLLDSVRTQLELDRSIYKNMALHGANDLERRLTNAESVLEFAHESFQPKSSPLSIDEMDVLFRNFRQMAASFKDVAYISFGSDRGQYVSVEMRSRKPYALFADHGLTSGYFWEFPFEEWDLHRNKFAGTAATDARAPIYTIGNGGKPYTPVARPWYKCVTEPETDQVLACPLYAFATDSSVGFNLSKLQKSGTNVIGVSTVSVDRKSISANLKDWTRAFDAPQVAQMFAVTWSEADTPSVIGSSHTTNDQDTLQQIDALPDKSLLKKAWAAAEDTLRTNAKTEHVESEFDGGKWTFAGKFTFHGQSFAVIVTTAFANRSNHVAIMGALAVLSSIVLAAAIHAAFGIRRLKH